MKTQRARPSADESGFTIVELTVALGLLAIVAASMAGVFWSAIRTAGSAAHRTAAAAITSREIESMRSVPYESVGFYGDQTGYISAFEGHATVTLASSTPIGTAPQIQLERPDPLAAVGFAPDPYPENASAVTQGGVAFEIQRYIVWIDARDASTTYTQAYKQLSVVVTWSDAAMGHTVRQDSVLYPGGQGTYGGPKGAPLTTTTTTFAALNPTAPILAAATVPADPTGRTEIDLTWSQPAGGAAVTSYTVQYSTDSGFPAGSTSAVANLPGASTSYPVTALASSTTYYFKVTAYAGTHTATSNALSATTLPQPVAVCVLGALTVTGATSHSTTGSILTKGTGRMPENLTLGFSTTGPCTHTYQAKGVAPSGTADQGSPYALTSNGSGSYSGTVLSFNQKNWAIGLHTFTVWDVTTNTATTVVKTYKVCAAGSATC